MEKEENINLNNNNNNNITTKDKIASFLEEFVLGKKDKSKNDVKVIKTDENNDSNNVETNSNEKTGNGSNITGKFQIEKMIKLFKAINTLSIMKSDDKPVEIIDNIYIGSFAAAQNKEVLKNENITHILNAASIVKNFYPEEFIYLKIENLLDSPESDIKQYFDKSIEFIKDCLAKGGKVLVHCHAGISRSSTLIISYMIKEKEFNFEDALVFCKNKREKINPNEGFRKQLKQFEETIRSFKKSSIEITVNADENNLNFEQINVDKDDNNKYELGQNTENKNKDEEVKEDMTDKTNLNMDEELEIIL